MRRHLVILGALTCLTSPALAQQHGAGAGDIPGHSAFKAGARLLYADDWSTTSVGDIPETVKLVSGTMEIVEEDGRHLLKISEGASFDLVLSGMLPESYTIDFDMRVPASRGYSVEIRPEVAGAPAGYAGLSRRMQHPVVHCGAIGSGVYGDGPKTTKRFHDRFATALVPCEIAVSAKGVRVYFAGELAANQPGANLGRAKRLRIYVPASEGQEAYVSSIRVATDVGAEAIASAPVAAEPPAAAVTDTASVPVDSAVAPAPARSPEPATRRSAEASSASRVAGSTVSATTNLKGLPDRIRRRAEARAAERLDSATSRAEEVVGAGAEKALTTAGNATDKALGAVDRLVECLVTDLACMRRAKGAGARVAVTDSAGKRVSSADSARAMARAGQARP